MLEHALAYCRSGWPVFPCQPGGKRPATSNGLKDAAVDAERIRRWWKQMPSANIGIRTGSLVVVDIDSKAPDFGRGFGGWCALLDMHHGSWPETWTVATPSGGTHLYFAANGHEIRNSASKLAPDIDVRGHGGYVIGAGSVTPGGRYVLDVDAPPMPIPDWLAGLLVEPKRSAVDDAIALNHARRLRTRLSGRPTGYGEAALRGELEAVTSAVPGTRNDTLCRASFNLGTLIVGARLNLDQVAAALLDAALAVGLPEREAVATIRSGLAAGLERPRTAA